MVCVGWGLHVHHLSSCVWHRASVMTSMAGGVTLPESLSEQATCTCRLLPLSFCWHVLWGYKSVWNNLPTVACVNYLQCTLFCHLSKPTRSKHILELLVAKRRNLCKSGVTEQLSPSCYVKGQTHVSLEHLW